MFETINCFIFGVFNAVAMNQILNTKLGIKPPRSLSNKTNHNHIHQTTICRRKYSVMVVRS